MTAGMPAKAERLKEQRWLQAEPLDVSPALVGVALAAPERRAVAMVLDLVLLALLGEAAGFWLVCGLALVVLLLRSQRGDYSRRQRAGWIFAALLGLLALQEAFDHFSPQADEEPAVQQLLQTGAAAEGASAASAPAASAAASAPAEVEAEADAGPSDAERIVQLQAELAELKKPRPVRWRDEFVNAVEAFGVSFGWGIVYFSLLPAWWNGQTLGKKLMGLRIIELTGQPLTVMRCLRRYGGYAAGMATGGLGFMQALTDVNRQGIQDRVAHTVVVDLRLPAAVAPPRDATG
jgi:RDD family